MNRYKTKLSFLFLKKAIKFEAASKKDFKKSKSTSNICLLIVHHMSVDLFWVSETELNFA